MAQSVDGTKPGIEIPANSDSERLVAGEKVRAEFPADAFLKIEQSSHYFSSSGSAADAHLQEMAAMIFGGGIEAGREHDHSHSGGSHSGGSSALPSPGRFGRNRL